MVNSCFLWILLWQLNWQVFLSFFDQLWLIVGKTWWIYFCSSDDFLSLFHLLCNFYIQIHSGVAVTWQNPVAWTGFSACLMLQHPFRQLLELCNGWISGEFSQLGRKSAWLLSVFGCKGRTCSQHRTQLGCSSIHPWGFHVVLMREELGSSVQAEMCRTARWKLAEKHWHCRCSEMWLWQWT